MIGKNYLKMQEIKNICHMETNARDQWNRALEREKGWYMYLRGMPSNKRKYRAFLSDLGQR